MTTKTKPVVKTTVVKKEPAAKTVVKKVTKSSPVKEAVVKPEVAKPMVKKSVGKVNTKSPLTKEEKKESAKITKMMNDNFDAGSPPGLLATSGQLTITKTVPVTGKAPRPSLAGLFNTGVLRTH